MSRSLPYLPLLLLALPCAAFAAEPFEILESDETRVRVQFTLGEYRVEPVDVDGETYHRILAEGQSGWVDASPGSPELPSFTTRIGVPPGMGATVTVVERDLAGGPEVKPLPVPENEILPATEPDGLATPRVRYTPDAAAYARVAREPVALASAGERSQVRNLHVVPLHVAPFRYTGQGLSVARRVVVDVVFQPLREMDGRSHVPVRRDPAGERLYDRLVLNADDTRDWRVRRPTQIAPSLRTRALRRGTGPEMKLHVPGNRNELVRVTRARLAAAGWTATPAVEDLRLATRSYDASELDAGGDPFLETPIGILVDDADDNGLFDGGDSFVFYAQDAKTQRDWVAPEDRYSWDNVYWLFVQAGAGTSMPTRDWTPSGGTVEEPTSYEYWKHYEEQLVYYWYSYFEEERDRNPLRQQLVDHLTMLDWARDFDPTWGGPEESIARLPFEIRDPAPGTNVGARASWRGLFNVPVGTKRFRPAIYPGRGAMTGTLLSATELLVNGYREVQYDSNGLTLPSTLAVDGVHEFVTERYNTGGLTLDWFEIGYMRQFVAHEDRLHFTNGTSTGRVRWTITGFTGDDVVVLDMADRDMPVVIQPETSGSGSVAAVFEDDVATSGSYLAQRLSSIPSLAASDIELDEPSSLSDLLDPQVINADYLVVVYDDFLPALQPLIDHRAQQGLTPLVAKVSDVYDEFSGGLFSADAIREFVRYCYRLHPGAGGVQPLHLLLVGDASEDFYGVVNINGVRTSMPNFVPSYMVFGFATDQGSTRPLISTDHWFIANPDASNPEEDLSTSMMVGRLPTGSVAETEKVVSKILRYEDDYLPDPTTGEQVDQPWRRRGLAISDDCYSGTLDAGGGDNYGGSAGEGRIFQGTSLRALQTVQSSGLQDFEAETFFLSEILDTIPELERQGDCSGTPGCGWQCTLQYCRNVLDLDGMLISRANAGHLFVTYQGHGNRSLVSHEYALMGNGGVSGSIWPPGDGNVEDVERFTNIERWPIWFFFACHVAELGRRDEARSTIGDCLAERLLLSEDAGSIASVASTGFEWLNDNEPIHDAVFRAWFDDPYLPDPTTGEPGMLLGEIMYGAKIDLLTRGSPRPWLAESYMTLGDPALRVDIAPPRFQVWQDQGDAPWDDPTAPEPMVSGAPIRGASADATTTHFAARIADEVPIEADDIEIHRLEDGVSTPVDPSGYTLTPGAPDPVGAIRSYTISYTAPLEASDHEYVFSATDYNERTMNLRLVSRVSASFFVVDEGRPARPISSGAFVAAGSRVRAVLDSPVGLAAEDIELTMNGKPLDDVIATPVESGAPMSAKEASLIGTGGASRAFAWNVEAVLDAERLEDGANVLGVRWLGGDETESREVSITADPVFRLDRYFAFPNPFESETDIFYRVSGAADRARVRVYTLSGRLIRTLEQAAPVPDLNRIHWDGRDDDGDRVANGVYFYQLELVGPDGAKTTEQGKLARLVGHQAVSAPPNP